jgi:hypothetical protein
MKALILSRCKETESGCLEWQGAKNSKGYGQLFRGGKTFRTHRVMADAYGTNLMALHICDNPSCCNPDHIYLGSAQDNVDDRDSRGRYVAHGCGGYRVKGEEHHQAKLTDELVLSIKQKISEGYTNVTLARDFGVAKCTISRIKRGVSWQHVLL